MITREELLAQQTGGAKWDVAVAIKRGNPLPLDESSLFESYEKALEYAQTSAVAYPTQIIGVVNADGTNEYYGITQAGGLEEIGGKVDVDGLSIMLDGEKLALRGYGKQYYKYVTVLDSVSGVSELPADASEGVYCKAGDVWYIKNAEGWVTTATYPADGDHYVLTEGFVAGLQPKVELNSEGKLQIAWYEPSATTVEGLSEQMSSVTQTVNTMQGTVSENAEAISNMYNKEEVDAKDKAINDVVNTTIKDASYDSASGKVTLTKVDGTTKEVTLTGVAHGATYDSSNLKLTIPVYGQDDVVVNIPRDKFIRTGRYEAEYAFAEGTAPAIVLVVDDEDSDTDGATKEIAIPASALVDVYTGENSSTAKVTVSDDNKIKVEVILSGIAAGNLMSVDATGAPVDLGISVNASTSEDAVMGDSSTVVPVASLIAKAIATAVSEVNAAIEAINQSINDINTKLSKIYIGEGNADEIITSTTDGIQRSGKKVGGATLSATPDSNTVATEAAVAAMMSWGTLA